ncbi:hypothetical protein FEM03_18770 [Phragmitibacter flavus]|uniref:Uncharacterized protein n=1 Tax=Phragmitibacter flavus TaxID=2576071 RepID=A0A5R8KA12_9BACT|nr:ribbon-helix-helix protein, CopG family [Phragmitibacter flavus]TLD69144.1 hypothetical protein FEM03_18770 [Phragmitibacter flavus]
MSYHSDLTRTSMALDRGTLDALTDLAKRWGTSKAEVIRRSVRKAKEAADRESLQPAPLEALDWLQNGGGLTLNEAAEFREVVQAERRAKRYWWEA